MSRCVLERLSLALLSIIVAGRANSQGIITTVAGTSWTFPATPLAALNAPAGRVAGVAADAAGNFYFSDLGNNMVFRVTPSGSLTVVAGNGIAGFSGDGGPAVNASLNSPGGLAVDSSGSVYIADEANDRIRKVSGGIISTVAGNGMHGYLGNGGPATAAQLGYPAAVAVDSAGNLYIADRAFSFVREVSGGIINVIAGTGYSTYDGDGVLAVFSSLNLPTGIAVDSAGNVYIADTGNHRIREITRGFIFTVAGDGIEGFSGNGGVATAAELDTPYGVSVDAAGNLYIAEYNNNWIRKVSKGIISAFAGNGAPSFSGDGSLATNAGLLRPFGTAIGPGGEILIADTFNQRVRAVSGGTITTVAGNGVAGSTGDGGLATSATFNTPWSGTVDSSGNMYIADPFANRVRKVSHGVISTIAGGGSAGFGGDGGPAASAVFFYPYGVRTDASGAVYVVDTGNNRIRKISNGVITTVAGNGNYGFKGDGGPATSASLSSPGYIAFDAAGNLYISDSYANRIRKVSNGIITTIAGNGTAAYSGDGGLATNAGINLPQGIAFDSAGNLYIAEFNSHRVRKVATNGIITTVAGNGLAGYFGDGGLAVQAELYYPISVAADASGNLYIADESNNAIRKVANGKISTVAGEGVAATGFSGDGGPATQAKVFSPTDVFLDSAANLYFVDGGNGRVREVLTGTVGLSAFPGTLTFSGTAGGALTAAQSINISSPLTGLSFAAAASVPWLTLTPAAGAAPGVVQVTADPSQLAANTYNASITISANGAVQNVNVTFTVNSATPPKLGASGPGVSFSAIQGSASSTTQIAVTNQGGGSLAFNAAASTSTGGSWLQVSPASGTATPSTPVSLTVTATPGTLGAGTYSGSIVVSSASGGSVTITATLSVSAAQQTILLSQTGMTFISVAQGGSPLPQSFGILNIGQGSMSWSASASTLSGGPWLSIDQSSGTVATPYTSVSPVNVSVNTAGMTAGTYYGKIAVTAPGAPNSPQTVSVSLNVLAAGSSPGAEVRPTGLIFIGQPGQAPGSQNVMISNPQSSPITFGAGFLTVPTGGTWAQFLPINATVQPNSPVSMAVQANYANLSSGVYQGFVSLGFLDGTSRVVHVLAVVAPSGVSSSAVLSGGTPIAQASGSCSPIQIQPTSLTNPGSTVTVGAAASLQVRVVDACGNLVTSSNGSVSATFSDADASVSLVHEGNGNWSGTWTPRNGASAQVQVNYKAFEGAGTTLLSGSANVNVSVQPANGTPLTVGTANAASYVGTYISPGGLVSIFGQQLAGQAVSSGNPPFPTNINGTQVLVGGIALPLRYVGGGQINAQVPFGLGVNTQQQLTVQNGSALSVPQNVVVASAQPGIYTQDLSGSGPGVIVDGNTNIEVTATNPAHIGDTLVIYCNGLGAVSPPVPTGTPAPSMEPLARTVNPVTVTIGGVSTTAAFAGLAPGYPDLYQVNAVIPPGVTPGAAVQIVLTVAGQSSPSTVTVAVQ